MLVGPMVQLLEIYGGWVRKIIFPHSTINWNDNLFLSKTRNRFCPVSRIYF